MTLGSLGSVATGGILPEIAVARTCPKLPRVDRRLAQKNLRTALIAGAVSLFVFAAAFLAAFVY
jgi:hypothetical protein